LVKCILRKYWKTAGNEREERNELVGSNRKKREIHVWYIDVCV
jgi:hypothetical protein